MKCNLSEIMNIIGGGTPKTTKPEYWNGTIPWLSVKDFANSQRYVYITEKRITEIGLLNSSANLLRKDDTIISARGTVGELAMIPFPMAFNQSCYGLRAKRDVVDPVFLYYLMRYHVGTLKKNTHGSVFDTITRDTFFNIEVEIPSLKLQRQIAAILSSLDDKIELNNKINANLEQQARALFKAWFVDFEPFGGVCPKTWSSSSLVGIANYLNGLAMQKFPPRVGEKGLPVLKIKELRQGSCASTSDRCFSEIRSEYIVRDGDIVFSWSGSLLVDFWCGGACGLNQHLFKVTSQDYAPWFFYSWTKHHLANFTSMAKDKATTMGHIKRDALEKAQVLIPSEQDYQTLGAILAPMYEQIVRNRVANRKLAHLRNSLLPRLMFGEIEL